MPTTSPLRPRITTIGNSTRLSPIVSWSSCWVNSLPVKSGITTPAARMKTAVMAPRIARIRTNSVLASWKASRLRPFSSSSVNTGTKAALRAASANSERTRLGTWKAIVNAEKAPDVPKYDDATISRTSPAMRESPVAAEKIAVLRAMPRPGRTGGGEVGGGCSGSSPEGPGAVGSTLTGALSYGPPRPTPEAFARHGQHRLPEEAHPPRPARAAREPPLHVDDQDVLPPLGGRRRRRRRHEGRHRSPRADLADRQGRQDGRPAPQQRRAQEEPRGAGAPRRRERLALPRSPAGVPRRGLRRRRDPLDRAQGVGVLVEFGPAAGAHLELGQGLERRTQRGDVRAARIGDEAVRRARRHAQRALDLRGRLAGVEPADHVVGLPHALRHPEQEAGHALALRAQLHLCPRGALHVAGDEQVGERPDLALGGVRGALVNVLGRDL